jgi:hypothetical protein
MDFILCKVTFYKVNTCHCQHVLANVVLIPSHASKVQHMQFSEYLLIRNCMVVKNLHQFFYYHNKHRIKKSCTWGYKHAFVILGLKLGQFRNLGG